MDALERVAARHGLALVEDACQAHLATADGRPVGTIGVAGAFSFYPTKNLGALGDGGAVTTARPGTRRADQAAAQRRPDLALSPRGTRASTAGSTRCRRRSCARGCRFSARWTERRRDASPPGTAAAIANPRHCRPAGIRCGACLPPVSGAERRARCVAGASQGAGGRDADSLPGPDPRQPALAAVQPADCPGCQPRLRARSSRSRCIPRLLDDRGRRRDRGRLDRFDRSESAATLFRRPAPPDHNGGHRPAPTSHEVLLPRVAVPASCRRPLPSRSSS